MRFSIFTSDKFWAEWTRAFPCTRVNKAYMLYSVPRPPTGFFRIGSLRGKEGIEWGKRWDEEGRHGRVLKRVELSQCLWRIDANVAKIQVTVLTEKFHGTTIHLPHSGNWFFRTHRQLQNIHPTGMPRAGKRCRINSVAVLCWGQKAQALPKSCPGPQMPN